MLRARFHSSSAISRALPALGVVVLFGAAVAIDLVLPPTAGAAVFFLLPVILVTFVWRFIAGAAVLGLAAIVHYSIVRHQLQVQLAYQMGTVVFSAVSIFLVGLVPTAVTWLLRRGYDLAGNRLEKLTSSMAAFATALGDGIVLIDEKGKIVRFNPGAERLTGWRIGEVQGRLASEVLAVDDGNGGMITNPSDLLARVRPGELSSSSSLLQRRFLIRRDGSRVPIVISGAPIPSPVQDVMRGMALIFRDDTKDSQLGEVEDRYRALFDEGSDPIFLVEYHGPKRGRIVDANAAALRLYGYTADEIRALQLEQLLVPGKPLDREKLRVALEAGQTIQVPTEQWRSDGSIISVEVVARTVKIGGKIYVLSIHRDITEKNRAAEALEQSERRLLLALDAADAGLWDLDLRSQSAVVSDRMYTLRGFEPQEFPWRLEFDPFVDPADLYEIKRRLQDHLDGKTPIFDVEYRNRTKQGGWIWIHARGRVLERSADGVPLRMVGIDTDITARKLAEERRKRTEAQLAAASRLASIGTLAAGMGHEINNPLAIIKGNATMLRDELQAIGASQETLDMVAKQEAAIERISRILRGIRLFARSDAALVETLNIHQVIEVTCSLVAEMYKRAGCVIELRLKASNYFVKGNIGKLQQVLLHLLSNARDAMEQLESKPIIVSTEDQAGGVVLKVADRGVGIPPENLEKVFDPFFTTKDPGKGTGLGLALTHSVITEMGGLVSIDSSREGTVITALLPTAGNGLLSDLGARPAAPKTRGRVLVVDDEPEIRNILREFLSQLSLEVHEAAGGQQALEAIAKAHAASQPFDLIFLDLVMPDLPGDAVIAEAVRRALPLKRLIIMTGESIGRHSSAQRDLIQSKMAEFVRKPFDRREIWNLVLGSQALD